jgi:hypothetical protein
MPIPEPFTPTALSAGILTKIATDILKHHSLALEGTLQDGQIEASRKDARVVEVG